MLLSFCFLSSLLLSLELRDPDLLFLGCFLLGLLLVVVFVAALGLASLTTSSCGEEGVDVNDVLEESPLSIRA